MLHLSLHAITHRSCIGTGRDLCADEIDETLNIAESTINKFFKMFIYNYAAAMYSKYVFVHEGEDLDKVEEVYRKMGFPGMYIFHIFVFIFFYIHLFKF